MCVLALTVRAAGTPTRATRSARTPWQVAQRAQLAAHGVASRRPSRSPPSRGQDRGSPWTVVSRAPLTCSSVFSDRGTPRHPARQAEQAPVPRASRTGRLESDKSAKFCLAVVMGEVVLAGGVQTVMCVVHALVNSHDRVVSPSAFSARPSGACPARSRGEAAPRGQRARQRGGVLLRRLLLHGRHAPATGRHRGRQRHQAQPRTSRRHRPSPVPGRVGMHFQCGIPHRWPPHPGRWETCCSAAVARAPLPEHAFSECSAWAAGREQLWPRARVLCPRAARSESSPSREQLVCSVRGQLAESSPGREQLCPRAARGQLPRAALSESGSARERTERGRVSSGRRRSVTSSRTS